MSYIDPEDRPAPQYEGLQAGERMEDAAPAPKRRGAGFLVAAGLVIIFGLGVWFAYSQGVQRGGNIVPPLIKADQAPLKRTPDDPGGMQVPNQDKQIFESMNNAPAKAPTVERLLPPPEQPKPEPPAPRAPTVSQTPTLPAAPAPAPTGPSPTLPTLPQANVGAVPTPAPVPVPPASVVEPQKPVTLTPTPLKPTQPPAAAPGSTPPSAPVPAKVASTGGSFRIQLGALADQAAAEAEWKKISQAHADILGGLPFTTEKVEVPGKGTFYRMQAGAFPDRATASAVCERLKAVAPKQGCLVAARG